MQTAGARINQGWQGIDVRALELGQAAILDHLGGYRVQGCQFLQHVRVGRRAGLGLADHGQAQFAEKNLGQLLGRADVEGSAHSLVNLVFEGRDGPGDLVAQLAEKVAVQADTPALDACQNGNQRQLDLAIDLGEARGFHGLFLVAGQGQRGPGFVAQGTADLFNWNLARRPRGATAAEPC